METVSITNCKSPTNPEYFNFGTSLVPATSTTSNGNSVPIPKSSPFATIQAIIQGTGAVSATVTVQATLDPNTALGMASNWITLAVISLSGTGSDTGALNMPGAPWKYVRATVASITGTGATVQVLMGT